jgi:DNA-binding HxlR family transcriptional regulator
LTIQEPKPRRFVELQKELQMSPNTLSDRLHRLVAAGLLKRTAYNEIPPRVEYAPTSKAIEFDKAFHMLTDWAGRNSLEPEIVATR